MANTPVESSVPLCVLIEERVVVDVEDVVSEGRSTEIDNLKLNPYSLSDCVDSLAILQGQYRNKTMFRPTCSSLFLIHYFRKLPSFVYPIVN